VNWEELDMCKTTAQIERLYRNNHDDSSEEMKSWIEHVKTCPLCAEKCAEFWSGLFVGMVTKALAPSN
jgi:hypothetical protein